MITLLFAIGGLGAALVLAWYAQAQLTAWPTPIRQGVLAVLVFSLVVGFGAWSVPRFGPTAQPAWEVGQLRSNGLRLIPSGRADARDVLAPSLFEAEKHRKLYGIATDIPEIMNQLYCWCGCIKQGRHRSALACYEDRSSTSCGVCQETARIAWQEFQKGETDPAQIQVAIDQEWAPPGYRILPQK